MAEPPRRCVHDLSVTAKYDTVGISWSRTSYADLLCDSTISLHKASCLGSSGAASLS